MEKNKREIVVIGGPSITLYQSLMKRINENISITGPLEGDIPKFRVLGEFDMPRIKEQCNPHSRNNKRNK